MSIPKSDSGEQKRGESGLIDPDETPAPTGPVLTGSEYAQSELPMSLAATVVDESEPAVSDTASALILEPPTDGRITGQ